MISYDAIFILPIHDDKIFYIYIDFFIQNVIYKFHKYFYRLSIYSYKKENICNTKIKLTLFFFSYRCQSERTNSNGTGDGL